MKFDILIYILLPTIFNCKLTQIQGKPLQNKQQLEKKPRKTVQNGLASPLLMNSMAGAQVMSPFAQANTLFQNPTGTPHSLTQQLPGQQKPISQSFNMPILNVPEVCDHPKKQAFRIVAEALKHQKRFLINEVQKFLEKSKFVIGMSEVKMTRLLRRQLMGLLESYSSLTPENVLYVNQLGQTALENRDYAEKLAEQMLANDDLKPLDEEGNEIQNQEEQDQQDQDDYENKI